MRFLVILVMLIIEFIIEYFMFSFVQWNFNVYEWGENVRLGFALVFGMFALFIIGISGDNDFDDFL